MITLQFYHRDACHLCEDMWQDLAHFQEELGFNLERVDIDGSEALQARFGTLIPVLAAGDQVLCNYYLDPMALRKYLDQAAG